MATNNPLGGLEGAAAQAALGQQTAYGYQQTYATANNAAYSYYYSFVNGTTNIATQQTWVTWNQQYTEDQLRAIAELNRQQCAEFERQQEEQRSASAIARELLVSCLTPEQEKEFTENGTFVVETHGRRYRLSMIQNPVLLGPDGNPEVSYCIHTTGIPREDELLGFKLLLEANEPHFVHTANATQIHVRRARAA